MCYAMKILVNIKECVGLSFLVKIQPHIAAPAKHLQAIMMLRLKLEASFQSEGNGNGQGNRNMGA